MGKLRIEIAVIALLLAPFVGYGIVYLCTAKPRPTAAAASADPLPPSARVVGRLGT